MRKPRYTIRWLLMVMLVVGAFFAGRASIMPQLQREAERAARAAAIAVRARDLAEQARVEAMKAQGQVAAAEATLVARE